MPIYRLAILLCLILTQVAFAKPNYTCYQLDAQRKLTIDGDLSDWPNVPILLLGKQGQVASGTWSGPADSHAKVRMTWDKQFLYMSVEVIDNQVTQDTIRSRAWTMYQMDSLQWAVDLSNDGGRNFGEDNYEYGFGVVDKQPVVYRWHAAKGWPKGIAEHATLAVSPHPQGGVIYEAAIEYSMLTPLRDPAEGHKIGFCIVLQDQDADQHKTLQWTSGIADGKSPSKFGTVTFSRATPSAQGGKLLISANKLVGADGVNLSVMSTNTSKIDGPLFVHLKDMDGKTVSRNEIKPTDKQQTSYQGVIDTQTLKPAEYNVAIENAKRKTLIKHSFIRSNVEQLDGLIAKIANQSKQLDQLIKQAKTQGIQTRYPLATLTTARVYEPYIVEDIKLMNFEVALHNAHTIDNALAGSIKQLQDWLATDAGTPDFLRVPELDYSKTTLKGKHLVIDDKPVMLVGPMSWLWQVNKDIQNISDVGYNYVKFGWMGQHHFDKNGQLFTKDKPYWAARHIFEVGKQNKMAVGISMMCPDQVWRGASRRGELTLGEFHKIYDQFAAREIPRISKDKAWDYTVEVEKQRSPVTYDPKYHKQLWMDYLASQYGSVEKLNSLYKTSHASFDVVPFEESQPENPAKCYDWVRLRQIMIANELTRAAQEIRKIDDNAIVHGYPYVWTFREPAAYYGTALDPELDVASYDLVGCDTSGAYYSDRYAISTINWLAGYYDLMRSIAGDRPLSDGEFHFANRRKIYPPNWSRAIYFQSYVHGLSYSSSWVWTRNGRVDCALLLDAGVLLGSGQASLDLQRVATPIAAFHDRPDDVVILYSNASSPHTRRLDSSVVLSQTVQTDNVYEGMYFEGMQVGYLTEQKIAQGLLKTKKMLIVPNCSHVERSTRDAIEDFARAGGKVVLVGDSLLYSPQGEPLAPIANLPTVGRLDGFIDSDQARAILVPMLKESGVLPSESIQVENGKDFPTVEWRFAVDPNGENYLYVMNMGHEPAQITLPTSWNGAVDLLDGQTMAQSTTLNSLQFRMLKKKQ